jgi:hypothetical protein
MKIMLRKIAVVFTTLSLLFVSTPSFAGEDWGWHNGLQYHPKYYVMNIENEGFFYDSCYEASDADITRKLQVKLSGKKSKWKTVSTAIPVFSRFDNAKMQLDGWYIECDDPAYPVILVFNWNPPNWQKDYPARIIYGKKNKVQWTGTIVIHPNLKKIKPYT